MNWHTVLASREGLEGHGTSTGLVIRKDARFVALPSVKALWRTVAIRFRGELYIVPVLDVGPWNENDDRYVFNYDFPLAAHGIGKYTKPTNSAGIDLSDGLTVVLLGKDEEWGLRVVEWSLLGPNDLRL